MGENFIELADLNDGVVVGDGSGINTSHLFVLVLVIVINIVIELRVANREYIDRTKPRDYTRNQMPACGRAAEWLKMKLIHRILPQHDPYPQISMKWRIIGVAGALLVMTAIGIQVFNQIEGDKILAILFLAIPIIYMTMFCCGQAGCGRERPKWLSPLTWWQALLVLLVLFLGPPMITYIIVALIGWLR